MVTSLPPSPRALVQAGAPQFGLWSGTVADASLRGLAPPFSRQLLGRKLVEKKWVYTLVATPEIFLCMAIIDAGLLHSCFLGLFDRKTRTLLADLNLVLPGLFFVRVGEQPSALSAQLRAPGMHASIEQTGGGAILRAKLKGVELDLQLDASEAPIAASACADLGDGRFDFTQKKISLGANGIIAHGGRSFRVASDEGALAGLDFTHGYLRRETNWRWAYGMGASAGHKLGFNFSEGFLLGGTYENVVWLDGTPRAVGEVSFSFDAKDPRAPWYVRAGDGTVDLEFMPEGQRAQNVWTPLMASRYAQPFGVFRGKLPGANGEAIAIDGIAGVTEDHAAKW